MPRRQDGADGLGKAVALCWRQPGLLAVELAWRWSCGALLLAVGGWQAWRIAQAAQPAVEATGITRITLESITTDPDAAAASFHAALAVVQPPVLHAVAGLAPLGLFLWVCAFAWGRTALLHRYDPALPARRFLLAVSEALRLLALGGLSWLWYAGVQAASGVALGSAGGANLPLYLALVIALTLGLFVFWSVVGWVLLAAPLVGILQGLPFRQALAQGFVLRRQRRKLLEANLVLAVVKLALLVLAAVFSASPLPFVDAAAPGMLLYGWYAFVTLLYLAAADFFKVARLLAFAEFCRGSAAG